MCVCVRECAHTVGDYFSVNTQGLGRVSSIQELGRQASWVGHRPTPDPGWGCQDGVCQAQEGKDQKDGPGRQIPQDICRPP